MAGRTSEERGSFEIETVSTASFAMNNLKCATYKIWVCILERLGLGRHQTDDER